MSLSPQTQPTDPPSLHHLEQLARQRAEHCLHVGNYRETVKIVNALDLAQTAMGICDDDTIRVILNKACGLKP